MSRPGQGFMRNWALRSGGISRDRPKSLGTRSDIAQEAREMTIQSPRSVAPPHNGLMPRSPYRCTTLACQRCPRTNCLWYIVRCAVPGGLNPTDAGNAPRSWLTESLVRELNRHPHAALRSAAKAKHARMSSARQDVFRRQVGKIIENLSDGHPGREVGQDA